MATNSADTSSRDSEMTAGSAWTTRSQQPTRLQYDDSGTGPCDNSTSSGNPTSTSSSTPANGSTTTTTGTSPVLDSGPPADTGPTSDVSTPASILGTSGLPVTSGLTGLDTDSSGTAPSLDLAGSGATTQPVFNAENATVLDFHQAIETLSDETGLAPPVHALTNTGETAGLGHTGTTSPGADGQTNLVTDAVNLPGAVLDGDGGAAVSNIDTDLGATTNAADGLVTTATDTNNAISPVTAVLDGNDQGVLDNSVPVLGDATNAGGLLSSALNGGGVLNPVPGLLSGANSGLQLSPLLDVNGVTNGANTLGALGSNGLPSPVSNLVGDVDNGLNGTPLADVTGLDNATGGLGTVLPGIGTLSPVSSLVGGAGNGLEAAPLAVVNGGNNANDGGLLGGTVGELNGSSSGHLVNADVGPQGNGTGVDILDKATPADHTLAVNAVDTGPNGPELADLGVATGANGTTVPTVPGLSGLGLQNLTPSGALATLDGGNNANDGGIAGATVGNLNGSSDGHLINADAGAPGNGTGVDLLDTPTPAGHAVNVNAVDVGPDGPQLLDAGVLTGDTGVPALNGLGLQDLGLQGIGSRGLGSQDLGLQDLGLLGLSGTSGDLATIDGGNNADDGGILGGTIGDLDGSSDGHLVNADAGPQGNGTGIDLLDMPTPANNTLNATAVDVGSHGPQLADLGLLTGTGAISVPSLNGTGLDSMVGQLLGTSAATPVNGSGITASTMPVLTDLLDGHGLVPGSTTGDHGILDVAGHHII